MTSPIGFYLAAMLAGVAFVVQQAANAKLRGALGSGLWAGFTNFAVGGIAVLVVIAILRESVPTISAAGRAPWYAWIGGGLGALYIVGSVFLLPRIGAASLIALILVGQMLASLAFDHFGLMGVPVHEANSFRIFGAVLLIAGVALISMF
ncbi:DMT family transporter [Methylobacterium sp. Leaf456]|uniref:DMT family transporter n=1 Tax=Methylobacterium sp. Leaf456 TaxID=1736382 RepID=UPI000B28C967|nr:DMT family transporter [Methylobacterium sp. Leaf456]